MRIISQDGRTDIPYENFVFGITKDNSIVAIRDTVARPSEVAHGVVAKYSTESKAQKAMEMLHEAYCGVFTTKINVGEVTLDELKTQLNEWKPQLLSVSDTSHAECKYFRFPSDEDVEG